MTEPNDQPSDTYELPEDIFGREAIAEKIKGLLESDIDLSPMVIDGDWGIGKTVFCHRLINKINESQQLNCVYIDAFRADHIDDPLISIISEIGKLVEKNGGEGKLDSFIDGAKPFIRTAAKTLGKAAVSFALKQSTNDIAEGYDKEVEALAGASIDASIDLVIRDKINAEKNLDTLHEALKEVTKEKELIILIDELDRCRATFAIDMLETIKHAFTIPKVKIVIVANASHLETSFRHRYGSNNETKSYLEKFYKYKYSLPLEKLNVGYNNIEKNTSNSFKHLLTLKRNSDIDIDFSGSLFKTGIEGVIRKASLSLREIEQIFKRIEIISHLNDNNECFSSGRESFISIFFIHSHIKNPSISSLEKKEINLIFGYENYNYIDYDTGVNNAFNAFLFIINDNNKHHSAPIYLEKLHHALSLFDFTRDINYIKNYISDSFKEIHEILKMT
jgi:DNA polymerase III delta prime subunit